MMDALASYMWVSAYAFQLVLLTAVVWGVIAFRKLHGFPRWFFDTGEKKDAKNG